MDMDMDVIFHIHVNPAEMSPLPLLCGPVLDGTLVPVEVDCYLLYAFTVYQPSLPRCTTLCTSGCVVSFLTGLTVQATQIKQKYDVYDCIMLLDW